MKRLLIFLLLASGAYGQSLYHYENILLNQNGTPITGATVWVCTGNVVPNFTATPPCPLATIYSDLAGTVPIVQPTTTSPVGNYSFFLAGGVYTATFNGTGFQAYDTLTIPVFPANPINSPNISNTLHVNNTGGYPTLAAALAACGSSPCTVHIDDGTTLVVPATTLGTAGACLASTTPYLRTIEADSNVALYLSGQLTLNCEANIRGSREGLFISPCTGTNTPVSGCSTFTGTTHAGSKPLIVIGDGVNSVNSRLEGATINCNLVSGVTAIYGQGMNENSVLNLLNIPNCSAPYSVEIEGTNVVTGNFPITDITIADSTSTGHGLVINTVTGGVIQVNRISVVSNTPIQSTGSCIHVTGSGAGLYYSTHVLTERCEKHNDGILVDGTFGLRADDIEVGNGGVNVIRVASTASTNVIATWMRNNNIANNVFVNEVTSKTISANNPPAPGGVITFWSWTTGGTDVWNDVAGWHLGGGSSTVYKCATSGALPAGALTTVSGSCGTTTDTGLRVP